MDETVLANLAPPRFENGRALLVAGLAARYNAESTKAIPLQWQRFMPQIGHVPGQVGWVTYGVCCNSDDDGNFDYISGVEVRSFSDLPADLTRVRIPARRYAVFTHGDHVSTIRRTWNTIWSKWMPESGHEVADAPDLERYENFDPETGTGIIEIWIPLKG